ncbi:DNA primase, partial [Singulisphaera rosea]
LSPIVSAPLPKYLQPAPWEDLLATVLARIDERDWQVRLRDLQDARKELEADPEADPASRLALRNEMFRHQSMRPDTKKKSAS